MPGAVQMVLQPAQPPRTHAWFDRGMQVAGGCGSDLQVAELGFAEQPHIPRIALLISHGQGRHAMSLCVIAGQHIKVITLRRPQTQRG